MSKHNNTMLFRKILSICTQEKHCIKLVAKATVLFMKEILSRIRMISLCQDQRKHVQIVSQTVKAAICMYVCRYVFIQLCMYKITANSNNALSSALYFFVILCHFYGIFPRR